MKWTDDLAIGVDKIDQEHKGLIDAVNALFDACSKGLGRKKIGETLQYLKQYVVTHFSDEETIQREAEYPAYPAHKKMHDAFVKDVLKYEERFDREGPTIALVADFNMFVSNWLIHHISIEDKKIGAWIQSRK